MGRHWPAHAHNHIPRMIAIQGVGDASDRKHIQTGQKQCSHARIINKRIEAARCFRPVRGADAPPGS